MTVSVKNQPHRITHATPFYLLLAGLSLGIWVQTYQIQKLQSFKL